MVKMSDLVKNEDIAFLFLDILQSIVLQDKVDKGIGHGGAAITIVESTKWLENRGVAWRDKDGLLQTRALIDMCNTK